MLCWNTVFVVHPTDYCYLYYTSFEYHTIALFIFIRLYHGSLQYN